MPTLADILSHDLFAHAHVVAGMDVLEREVRWVHHIGVPDAANWLDGGELVLATFRNVPASPREQREYIRQLAEIDIAGLVLTVGQHGIECIPDPLIQAANDHRLPLIEMPYQTRFIEIAKTINEMISQSSLHLMERALYIQQSLTDLVLEGGNLSDLAVRLANLIGHSVSIENERFEAIATCDIAPVDEARRFTQLHKRTDPRLLIAMEQFGILAQVQSQLNPIHIEPMPQVGLEMERILAPIVVHGDIYGYMWIIADDRSLSRIDHMAIKSGSTVAALMMLHQQSVQSAEVSVKRSLISQLIEGKGQETVLEDHSLRYGIDLRLPYVLMLVECQFAQATQTLNALYREINQMIASDAWQALIGTFDGRLMLIAQDNEHLKALAARVQERVALSKLCGDTAPRVGVSGLHKGVSQAPIAYEECQLVLWITQRLSMADRGVYFGELGYIHTLYQAGRAALNDNAYVPLLRGLLTEKQADLFLTLEAYLDSGGNGVATADSLHIHRSTLNYRLQRIYSIVDVSLQDPLQRTNLQIAIKLIRLFEVDISEWQSST